MNSINVASVLDKHGLRLLSARSYWLTAFAFLFAGHCLATDNPVLLQKLELPNGEVLIGTLKSEDDAVYVFVSQSLGEIRVLKKNAHLAPAAPAKAEMTALMYAASLDSAPILVPTLLKKGANAKVVDKSGKTAVDYAKQNAKLNGSPVLQQLIDAS
jgi:hypothetical protein